MAITTQSLLDEIKNIFDDDNSKYMSDAEYESFIFKHTSVEGSYAFQRMRTGLYVYQGGDIWFENMTFDVQSSVDYTASIKGSIKVTANIDTRSQINVTATRCDFTEVVVDTARQILVNNGIKGPTSLGDGTFVPPNMEAIVTIMNTYRGIIRI